MRAGFQVGHVVLRGTVDHQQQWQDLLSMFSAPFISGKDSLNNEFRGEGETIRIPHTLLISALGQVEYLAGDYLVLHRIIKQIHGRWSKLPIFATYIYEARAVV